jgi:ABC-type cobalamin/Fe3+-siderophores transport systems, ATPase components
MKDTIKESGNESLLSVRELSFSYDKGLPDVFREISFTVDPGEVFIILGANGAGKSTLLNCVTGVMSCYRGSIRLQGRDIREISSRDKALLMGYVPQLSMPTFNYTVRDYVVMGRAPYIGLMGTPNDGEYAVADRVIREMGIEKLSDKLITRISGGERQQVQIARVLAQEAKLVILDEPTNHLDFGNQLKILRIIREMARAGLAIILTTHMPDHAFLLRGKIGILRQDGSMHTGRTDEILTENSLRELYHTDLRLIHIEELDRDVCVVGREAGLG